MKPFVIFRGSTGLNTVADPARIPISKNGINDVAEAVNVDIDQYYRISRRKGYSFVQAGKFHSLYCDIENGYSNNECFVVKTTAGVGDTLYQVGNDGSLTLIKSGLADGQRLSYAAYSDRTYYANGVDKGFVVDGINYDWTVGEYFGADTNRFFVIPDKLKHLEIFSGRLFASSENVLWWSEPFRPDLFCLAESFVQFKTNIRMIKGVNSLDGGGLYISTENNSYFLSGSNPLEFGLKKVCNFPAIEWSAAQERVDTSAMGIEGSGLGVVWASTEGAMLGLAGGFVINLNKDKVIYPEIAAAGFGCIVGSFNFLHGMK